MIAGLLGSDYRPNQMTYDLRRLRLNGLIRRLPHSNRYMLCQSPGSVEGCLSCLGPAGIGDEVFVVDR